MELLEEITVQVVIALFDVVVKVAQFFKIDFDHLFDLGVGLF